MHYTPNLKSISTAMQMQKYPCLHWTALNFLLQPEGARSLKHKSEKE